MTRNEKIAEAYQDYLGLGGVLHSNPWFAFKAGAEWADNNPVNVWHDASEEPQGEYEIICQDEFKNVWLTDYREDINHYKNGWKECAVCECIIRWAYIDDLIPKGGNV